MNPPIDRGAETARLPQIRPRFVDDLFGSLPFELLLQIVEYLDPADIVRSQRVSKRWRALFSHKTIITCALRQTLEVLGLEEKDVSVDDAMIYFRWRHGLQYARPVKKVFVPRQSSIDEKIVYHSRRLYYAEWRSDKLEILDLETGQVSSWTEELGNDLCDLLVSDRYVVMVCKNRVVTALDLQAFTRCTRQFPCQPQEICIVKDKVVMVGASRKQFPLIYIWDLKTYQVHGIGSVGEPFLWHVDVDENMLVIFEINWSMLPVEVQESKWTLNGKLLDRKCVDVSLSGRRLDEIRVLPAMNLRHSKYRTFGHKTVSRLFPEMFGKATMDLVYDHTVDKLAVRYDPTQSFKSYHDLNFYQTLTPYISYQWNSSFRQLEITNVANGTITMRSYQPDVREVKTLRELQQPQRQMSIDFYGPPLFPFGDREVLGLVSCDGIQLWFFNPSFVPDVPDAMPFLPSVESG